MNGMETCTVSNDWKRGGKDVPTTGRKGLYRSNDWKTGAPWFSLIGAVALCLTLLPGSGGRVFAEETPDGPALLARLRAALPDVPLRVSGELQSRDRRGNIRRVLPVEMRLAWGAVPPQAEYRVLDRFGREQERLRISWPADAALQYRYFSGDPLEEQSIDHLNRSIAGLDLYWSDLSLSFLWWEDARVNGSERVRGRYCHVVDVAAPANGETDYAGVRLWIDQEANLLMRADLYERSNQVVRRLQVTSLRKIDEVWMIQNMDIFTHDTRERITLRVRDLEQIDESDWVD